MWNEVGFNSADKFKWTSHIYFQKRESERERKSIVDLSHIKSNLSDSRNKFR
jgi:hypothetical protein